jgi:hypothetical protein
MVPLNDPAAYIPDLSGLKAIEEMIPEPVVIDKNGV